MGKVAKFSKYKRNISKSKETEDERRKRILGLCGNGDYGICPPPMNAQVAINELCRYLLGEDWYTAMPVSQEQVNTEIVYAIESKYKQCKK